MMGRKLLVAKAATSIAVNTKYPARMVFYLHVVQVRQWNGCRRAATVHQRKNEQSNCEVTDGHRLEITDTPTDAELTYFGGWSELSVKSKPGSIRYL